MYHLHGRDRRHWWKKVQRGHQCRQRDPGSHLEIVLCNRNISTSVIFQRTLMELLNQMDGFDVLGKVCLIDFIRYTKYRGIIICLISQVKMIMATNRPDTLDPALLRPGRYLCFGFVSILTQYYHLDWIERSRSLCRTSKPAWRCSRSTPTPSQRYPHLIYVTH